MGFWTRLLAFEEQLTFYAQYHHNGVNKAIHMVFVPVILATASLFLANYSLEGYFQQSPEMRDFVIEVLGDRALQFLASLTVAHLVAFGYGTYYILLEPFAGTLYVPFLASVVYFSTWALHHYPDVANWYALYAHVIAWIVQFIGHGVFEGRAPALLDNLVQALLLAPLFVWMEALFIFFNYRPKLRERIEEKAVKAIQEWKKHASKKKVK